MESPNDPIYADSGWISGSLAQSTADRAANATANLLKRFQELENKIRSLHYRVEELENWRHRD